MRDPIYDFRITNYDRGNAAGFWRSTRCRLLGQRIGSLEPAGALDIQDGGLVAVDQVAAVAADTVIVESAIELGTGEEPLVRYVGNDPSRPGTWHPSIPAMVEMFKESGFESLEPLFQLGGRGGIVARHKP